MKDQKGFGLVELAIVIAITVILSFSLLKGCEMIEDAKLKKFEKGILKWRESAKDYYNIKGLLPGDTNSNLIIGDEESPSPGTVLIQQADFINNPPSNPMAVGSLRFWVYYGNDGNTGNTGRPRNILVICADNACTKTFASNELKYVQSFDTVIDGEADGKAGEVKALSSITVNGSGDNRVVTHLEFGDVVEWASNKSVALVYYFKGRSK
ncbi:MAG: prepilin-type N-terminal cleavage/methylation domain-containing protein [Thermodesulfovibrionia bacterium]|nr:prepilin-type N-terminal cleavage/methylation domain-containing protein [Thermodesulfovibrionia bacterium]